MNINKQQLHFLVTVLVLLGYIPSVLAASEAASTVSAPFGIPLVKYGYFALMGTWGAMASILQKFSKGEMQGGWRVATATDLVNANLAAMLVFLGCEHFLVPSALQAIAATLGGYGGARTMETLYKKFIMVGGSAIDTATGTKTPTEVTEDTPK